MLKNREFYFSDPRHLNDPVDCQIGIYNALEAAVDIAEKEDSTVKGKLKRSNTGVRSQFSLILAETVI